MIPGPCCSHYWPALRRGCDAGLRAPHDCHQCPAYFDGTAYMGLDPIDTERRTAWSALHGAGVPVAHFCVNGNRVIA